MTRRLSARVFRDRGDSGTTLAELLVAVALLALVLSAGYGMVTLFQSETVSAGNAFTAESQGQLIMETLTKDLRAAVFYSPTQPAFIIASDTQVEFYANLNSTTGPELINIFLTPSGGSNFIQANITPADAGSGPNWTYSGQPALQMSGRYVNDSASPLFIYYDVNGNKLATPMNSATNTSALASIESVQIVLTTQVTPNSSPTTINTSVHIRNIDYNPQAHG